MPNYTFFSVAMIPNEIRFIKQNYTLNYLSILGKIVDISMFHISLLFVVAVVAQVSGNSNHREK